LGRTIDLGTGTGILAVAAAQLGARSVTAVDIDPACLTAARQHAALNARELLVVRGNAGQAFSKARFDLVLANLSSGLLIERRDEIAELCAPRARIVLSGLLAADLELVADAYSGLGPAHSRLLGEWAALLIKRP
jgi:ribosomal protein L11 methyltransferase